MCHRTNNWVCILPYLLLQLGLCDCLNIHIAWQGLMLLEYLSCFDSAGFMVSKPKIQKEVIKHMCCSIRGSERNVVVFKEVSLDPFPALREIYMSNIHISGTLCSSSLRVFFAFEWPILCQPFSLTLQRLPCLRKLTLFHPHLKIKVNWNLRKPPLWCQK